MKSWKQCALPATTMVIWQIMPSAHDVPLQLCSSCAQVDELQRSYWCDNREDTLFSGLHIHYACLAPVRFEQCVSWITYDHLCNIYIHRTGVGVNNLIQVWNIARHFSLSCFRYVVNSSVDRTEANVWMWPILTTFVKLYCNRLGSSMMLC